MTLRLGSEVGTCLDCGAEVPLNFCRFERRELSREELVAVLGEELAESILARPERPAGTLTVTSIGPGPSVTLDPEDS